MTSPILKRCPEPEKPYAELVRITPELAESWLTKNIGNRNSRDPKVRTYAGMMEGDNWIVTGDGPKFDTSGRLINGQHTLQAVVMSRKAVWSFVFWNLNPDAQLVMDMGAKRTIADALKFSGVSGCNLNTLAATARIAICWDEGFYRKSGQSSKTREVTSLETIEWCYGNPDAIVSVSTADLLRRSIRVPPSVLAFAHLLFSRIDTDEANRFFALCSNFQTSGKGDPIYTMLRRYQNADQAREKIDIAQHLFLIFRTWNAWRKGETLFQLKTGSVSAGDGKLAAITIPLPV